MAPDLVLLSRTSFRDQEIVGPRLQALIALLAGALRTGCGTGRLIEGIWPDHRPGNPPKALQILVSRARSQLGADLIVRTPTGYRLTLSDDQVDSSAVLLRAEATARCSLAGDHAAALRHADAGLALWAGAGPGPAGDPLAALRAERWVTHRTLVRARALALARLDRPAEAVELLAAVAAERRGGARRAGAVRGGDGRPAGRPRRWVARRARQDPARSCRGPSVRGVGRYRRAVRRHLRP
ncbi:hypothetical protein AB0C12_42110 [Actinoplanes sp. NPDC048967]|uniref:AfsR/SARP family transcriptional regulator n=1 Tax=Actinoplanes sp. NPDC048967 TaxID=3155269 RepID=UPI0033FDCB22